MMSNSTRWEGVGLQEAMDHFMQGKPGASEKFNRVLDSLADNDSAETSIIKTMLSRDLQSRYWASAERKSECCKSAYICAITYYYKGLLSYQSGNVAEATNFYNIAIEHDENCQQAYIGKGDIMKKQEDLDASNEWYTLATKSWKTASAGSYQYRKKVSHIALYQRGEVLEKQGEYEEALKSYSECVKQDARSLHLHAVQAMHRMEGKLDGKRNRIEKLEKMVEPLPSKECPRLFCCPLTCAIMIDPVLAMDGYCYERTAITEWLSNHETSPQTNESLADRRVYPNSALKEDIESWMKDKFCVSEL